MKPANFNGSGRDRVRSKRDYVDYKFNAPPDALDPRPELSDRYDHERERERGEKSTDREGGRGGGREGKVEYSVSIQLPWKVSHAGNPPFGIHSSPRQFTRTIGSTVGEYI